MNKNIRTPFAAILFMIIAVLTVFQFTDIAQKIFYVGNSFHVSSVIALGIDLALCGVLFIKKYNNILVILLGCQAVMQLYYLVSYFSIYNLLDFITYALLAVFALAVCKQTFVKADLTKIKKLFSEFFYLPAAIQLVPHVHILVMNVYLFVTDIYFFVTYTNPGADLSTIPIVEILLHNVLPINLVISLLRGFVSLSLGIWLKDLYAQEKLMAETEENRTNNVRKKGEAYYGLGRHIFLLLFTFGIWYLIWIYRTTKYLNKTPNAEYYNPRKKLLLCVFVPFYSIYWYYRHGQRLDSFTKAKGLYGSDMEMLCLLLGVFLPIVACVLMQDRINTICAD